MMAQRPDHNAYAGVNNAYNHDFTYDNNYPLPTDQFQSGDASWPIDASNLHNQQLVSRAASHSPAWPPQQQQHQQQQRPLASQAQHTARSTLQGYGDDAFQARSPYAFQQQAYQQPPYQPQQQYDPSLLAAPSPHPSYDARTIAPQSLERQGQAASTPVWPASRDLVDQDALIRSVPASQPAGSFSIINFDALVRATKSERMSSYANIGEESSEWPITRAALPAYVPRKSRNEMRKIAGNDPSLLSKISSSKRRKLTSRTKTGVDGKLKTEADDSSDYDSDTTDASVDEPSPAADKRPDTPKEAIEYDTIIALWRGKRKAVDADDVRKALVAFWDIVKTVRDRWKTDTAAVAQAEEKGTKGELPYLKQRVQDQRDMIETAFKTALKHGNRTILETMSENTSLIFLCYQFLLDRHKTGDINGPLARAILEVMAAFNTLTEDKIEKTHLSKILPRIIKSGDAKTQFYAKQITAKAAANKTSEKVELTAKTENGVKRPASSATNGVPVKKVAVGATKPTAAKPVEAVTAKKRLLGDDAAKNPAKRVATEVKPEPAKTKPVANKLTGGLFAGLQSAAKKPGTSLKTAGTVVKDAPKPPAPKPNVTAAAPVRPSFSLADTMKSIAKPKEEPPVVKQQEVKEVINETAEQKIKRLRKEARRRLRVHWKPLEELVSIREFTHDPEEDMGHDSSQTRDVADLKGEGRMFKQQSHMMDIDDDDEDIKLVTWSEPSATDFSDVDAEERKRNYSRFANGALQPDSPENAVRAKYEASTLMTFYEPGQAPANPSDPPQQGISGGQEQTAVILFGEPDKRFADRAQRPAGMTQGQIDFDKLRSTLSSINGISAPPAMPPPAQQPALDITSILAKFSSQQQQPQSITAPNQAWAGILPSAPAPAPAQQAPNGGAPDISAILAQLTGAQQPAAPQPAPAPAGFPMMDAGFMAFVAQQQAAAAAAAAARGGPSAQQASAGMYENPERTRLRDSQAD